MGVGVPVLVLVAVFVRVGVRVTAVLVAVAGRVPTTRKLQSPNGLVGPPARARNRNFSTPRGGATMARTRKPVLVGRVPNENTRTDPLARVSAIDTCACEWLALLTRKSTFTLSPMPKTAASPFS